jgi:uncharacterized membrane protein (UPF0127 family)/thioredoxin-like negative regulator of GroEL
MTASESWITPRVKCVMVSVIFSCAFLFALLTPPPAAAGIDWIQGTWDDALMKARFTHRPIMALFFKPSCEACVKFDSTLADSGIVAFSDGFVCARVDMEDPVGKVTADRFKVTVTPVTAFLDWKGEETDRVVGGREATQFLAEMKRIRSGQGTVPDLLTRESEHQEDVEFNALLGWKLSERGDPRARLYLNRVLTLDSTNVKGKSDDALFGLARIEKLDGDIAGCAALLEQMLRSYPNSELEPRGRISLAACYRKLGQNERAAALEADRPDNARSAGSDSKTSGSVRTMPVLVTSVNGKHLFNVEVASTPEEQNHGLMFRKDIEKNGGMLFTPLMADGSQPREASFWMKDTPTTLDIIFIRADGTIARIARNAEPFSTKPILSGEPVSAVIEILGGRSAELGIAEGDTVSWQKP